MAEASRNRLQSRVLLPFARIIMLWAAAAAFFITLGGFAIGVLLYAQSSYVPTAAEPPVPQLDSVGTWDPQNFAPEIEYKITNSDRGRLSVGDTVVMIYSAHDLDPIVILSLSPGAGSDRFIVVAPTATTSGDESATRRFRVTATAKLLADLADASKGQVYALNFVATFGKERDTRTSRFDVSLAFPSSRSTGSNNLEAAPSPEDLPEPSVPTSAAAQAAQTLALVIDPLRTPVYFAAYQRALRQIVSCMPDSETYGTQLNRALDANKGKLKRYNALRFEERVCNLWRTAAAKYAQETAARQVAMATAAAEALGRRATSLIALYVAGAALATFLMLALALALLAIENHVRVIRDERSA